MLALRPRCPQADYLLGEAARREGDYPAAERHLQRAIDNDPRVPYFHHALGNAFQDHGRPEKAIDAYRRALRLAPGYGECWNDLGTAYFAAGHAERAVHCYRRAVQHAEEPAVALSNLGATLRSLGDVRGALRAYRQELWRRSTRIFRRPPQRTGTSLMAQAEGFRAAGNTALAAQLAQQALRDRPDDPHALSIAAEASLQSGDLNAALALLERAAPSNDAALRARLGRLWLAAGRYDHARAALEYALQHGEPVHLDLAACLESLKWIDDALAVLAGSPKQDAPVLTRMGRLRLNKKDHAGAAAALQAALRVDAHHAPALAQLARLRLRERNPAEATQLCEAALLADPTCTEAQYWLGRALGLAGLWQEACEALREAAAAGEGDLGIASVVWLSTGLRTLEKPEEAEQVLRTARERWPDNEDVAVHYAQVIAERGDLARARQEVQRVVQAHPASARALAVLSTVANAEGDIAEAEAHARAAATINPEETLAHQNLALALLKRGAYAEGWQEYEARKQLEAHAGNYLRYPFPEWEGGELAGRTIFVYAEQGLGDEIMFASCLPDLVSRVKRVMVECEPRLKTLFQRSFPECGVFGRPRTVTNAWTRSLDPQPQVQTAIGSLPRFFRRSESDFPAHSGYLRADAARIASWRERLAGLGQGLKVGLSWRGGLMRTGRVRRSLELDQLLPLLRRTDIGFVSLQYGKVTDELAAFARRHRMSLPHWDDALADYDETAALVCALDAVVSVCTSLVHLTGALGKPVLVMAPSSPEWRYRMSGATMPWYPSARIYRQARPGDWGSVVEQVHVDLDSMATG